MGRDDWYRNKEWSADVESAFQAKLSRSRSGRPQYLRIQASYLAETYPHAALELIDDYFESGDEFDVSSAHCVRAEAFQTLGKIECAVAAYKDALDWEEKHPRVISTARIDFPKLVADNRLAQEYEYAIDILVTRFKPMDHQFPRTRYYWNGSNALIAQELGQTVEAREFAERALRAAAETESPFRYHRNVGLVSNTSDEFGRRLKRIASPSRLRSILLLITRGKS